MDRVTIVSADGHIGAPTSAYRPYMEARYLDDFERWAAHHHETTSERSSRKMEKRNIEPSGRPVATSAEICDPSTRLANLDSEGVTAEVLFPGPDFTDEHPVPFQVVLGAYWQRQDPELEAAGARAYNRWLADYCAAAKPRAIGIAHISCHDMDEVVAEVKWAGKAGLKGIHLPSADSRLPHYWDEYYEPLWRACVDNALPVHFHGATGYPEDFRMWQGDLGATAFMRTEATFWAVRPLKFLICGGVLERHPHLRVVFTETGNGWVPEMLQSLDGQEELHFLPLKPSEYWARQCYLGASLLRRSHWAIRDKIGVDRLMYGVDYPHPEGSWQRTLLWLQCIFGESGASETDMRTVVGETAIDVYALDREALRPVTERVGPTVAEVLRPPPTVIPPELLGQGNVRLA
jgi:predicted TIM-barrel fold metal-dependent hydrolase